MSIPEKTDEELAVLVQKGDIEQFGELITRYGPKITRYGKKFLQNSNHLEDIVQDIFLKAYRNIQSFDATRKFSSWLYRIAHNEFINEIRKNTRNPFSFLEPDILALYPAPGAIEKDYERAEILEMLENSVIKLEQKYREVLILYYNEEFSYKEIADILKIPIATVGVRLQRAKQKLKIVYTKLEKHG